MRLSCIARFVHSLVCLQYSKIDLGYHDFHYTVEPGYMGLRYVGHLSIWDSFPLYGETSSALHKPWLCGQLGWAVESPTYPGSTVHCICHPKCGYLHILICRKTRNGKKMFSGLKYQKKLELEVFQWDHKYI